jgi:hypothetical protein
MRNISRTFGAVVAVCTAVLLSGCGTSEPESTWQSSGFDQGTVQYGDGAVTADPAGLVYEAVCVGDPDTVVVDDDPCEAGTEGFRWWYYEQGAVDRLYPGDIVPADFGTFERPADATIVEADEDEVDLDGHTVKPVKPVKPSTGKSSTGTKTPAGTGSKATTGSKAGTGTSGTGSKSSYGSTTSGSKVTSGSTSTGSSTTGSRTTRR